MSKLLLVFTALLLRVGVAQVPIPGEPPGLTIGRGSGSAKVQLETYIDLLCPYSKAAYDGVKALADHYEPEEIRVKAVLFPLPFHQHGFTAAESVFTITSALGDDHFTPWLEVLYKNQERFWNKATKDLSAMQVTNELKELAKKTFPTLTDKQWEKGMTGFGGTEADQHTRVTWKYACTRTVTGTPQYTLNGVPFEEADSSWKLEDWLKVIDPLVKADRPKDDL
ncbi:hypothetical protein L915_20597 [Phytophthora nicotianae]|uniref:Thioredoxin-like fold domain-containing protein n=1 Tax=Phytophthora nicotianae TaxID=4792 RepID=W2FQR5_PHYNI|nr:hypothetical protein L915_20597 [Phytophthora nicotianae]ETM32211.1 hypothetical protein L914_20340 [Phytophthora nicotianae]